MQVSKVLPSEQRDELLSDIRRLREENEKLEREKRHLTVWFNGIYHDIVML